MTEINRARGHLPLCAPEPLTPQKKIACWENRAEKFGTHWGTCPICEARVRVATGLVGPHTDRFTEETCGGFFTSAKLEEVPAMLGLA